MDSKNWNVRTFKGYAGGKGDQSPAEVTLVVTTQANTVEQVRQLAQSAPDLLESLKEAHRVMYENLGPDMPEQSKAITRARASIQAADPFWHP